MDNIKRNGESQTHTWGKRETDRQTDKERKRETDREREGHDIIVETRTERERERTSLNIFISISEQELELHPCLWADKSILCKELWQQYLSLSFNIYGFCLIFLVK